jgi:2-polyprenyl-3-methyl-5-hydroxy-6-metoxy-1,4-benzoquinol methylase
MHCPDTHNPCGYCKEKGSNILYPTYDIFNNHYYINQCNHCHAFFLAPRPTDSLLSQAYSESYYGTGDDKFTAPLIEKILDRFRAQRAELLTSYLPGTGTVLDIGCGNGRFLSFVRGKGNFTVYGVEMEGRSAQRASRMSSIHFIPGPLSEHHFPAKSLDAITLFHVFEHLTEPVQMLDIISQIIKNNGILVISLPNIDSFQSKLFKGNWFHLDPPRHLFFFTPTNLEKILNQREFELLKEIHFSIEYNPFGMQQSILNSLLKKRDVLYESLKGNREYVREYSTFNLLLQKAFHRLTFPLFIALDVIDSLLEKGATVQLVFRKT